ncbi:MAG: DNA-binding GntR family transcriptional regulator [Paracoccaceae bacterium]|jgi:DNA-binding GntR family transcriptional regulator
MKNSSEIVIDHLRVQILDGAISPDQPIRQDLIAAELAVSRTPVRQALHQLAGEGLVTYDANRGARAAPILAGDIRDLFDMRLALEPIALAAAFKNHDKRVWAEAEMALDRAEQTNNSLALGQENAAFHMVLYAPCDRDLLLNTISGLTKRGVRAEIVALSIDTRTDQSDAEHHALLSACRTGNLEVAQDILTAHLVSARDDTLAVLDT